MYKVLKDVMENRGERTMCHTQAKVGGRVRSAAAKQVVAKQLEQGMQELSNKSLVDLKTGELKTRKTKKMPKAKTPQEMAMKEAKTYLNKLLDCNLTYAWLLQPCLRFIFPEGLPYIIFLIDGFLLPLDNAMGVS